MPGRTGSRLDRADAALHVLLRVGDGVIEARENVVAVGEPVDGADLAKDVQVV